MRSLVQVVAIAFLLGGATLARAETYRDELVARCPIYEAAAGRFAPVYPALAEQLVADYGITTGVCVDIGGGCGSLSLALAPKTDLTCYVLDIDPYAVRLCNLLAEEQSLVGRVRGVEGDAMDLPFRDELADLVVSRGSIFFWPDQLQGVREAYRILKPGGVAYVGGGFSRILDPAIREPLAQGRLRAMREGSTDGWRPLEPDLVERAGAAGIEEVRLIEEPITGWWLEIRKPAPPAGSQP
jgi:SAM-dependent methyltransferase